MATETRKAKTDWARTVSEDPETGQKVTIITTVKFPGKAGDRALKICAMCENLHKEVEGFDQTSLPLEDGEGPK